MSLAVHYSYASATSPEPETHTLRLDLPDAWRRWSDFEQGEWVLWQILADIDRAKRGGRPPWLKFGYELDESASLPC